MHEQSAGVLPSSARASLQRPVAKCLHEQAAGATPKAKLSPKTFSLQRIFAAMSRPTAKPNAIRMSAHMVFTSLRGVRASIQRGQSPRPNSIPRVLSLQRKSTAMSRPTAKPSAISMSATSLHRCMLAMFSMPCGCCVALLRCRLCSLARVDSKAPLDRGVGG